MARLGIPAFVMENVPGARGSDAWKRASGALARDGYSLAYAVADAHAARRFGVGRAGEHRGVQVGESAEDDAALLLEPGSLEEGQCYVLVVSDQWGLRRYQTEDVFRCEGSRIWRQMTQLSSSDLLKSDGANRCAQRLILPRA